MGINISTKEHNYASSTQAAPVANQVIFRDNNPQLISLYQILQDHPIAELEPIICDTISKYGLSDSATYGYEYYGCTSSSGLAAYNKAPYLRLRAEFNSIDHSARQGVYYFMMLLVLIIYGFNNQIRFNNNGEFNLPVGKRDFNNTIKTKLHSFVNQLQGNNYHFCCGDFRTYDITTLDHDSFIYLDPPYLISCAAYNERKGWQHTDEQELLTFIDQLNNSGIRFALSNVLSSNGKTNSALMDWARKYTTIHLHHSYANANYQRKNKISPTDEVLIINY